MSNEKKLFLNVDDVGLLPSINRAAVSLLDEIEKIGISLIPNGPVFDEAVRIAEDHSVEVGVHLGLIDEEPITETVMETDLVGSSGRFPGDYREYLRSYYFGHVPREALAEEMKAQVERVTRTGLSVTHINSHQHVHLLPGMIDLVGAIAQEYDIGYVRTVNEVLPLGQLRLKTLPTLGAKLLSYRAGRKLTDRGLRTNDAFLGIHPPVPLTRETVEGMIANLGEGLTEWGLHVASEDLSESDRFKSSRDLAGNFELIRSNWFRNFLSDEDVSLVTV